MNPFKNMMQKAQELQAQMAQAQRKLAEEEVLGLSGGGLVQMRFSGQGDLNSVSIDPSLLQDKELLEDLLVAAARDGRAKVEELNMAHMSALTGGMNLSNGIKFPFT